MFGLIPTNPNITTQKAENGVLTAVCVDADTERILQRQRVFAMLGSPLLIYAGVKMDGPLWLKATVAAMGGACFYAHFTAYTTIKPYLERN
jgi:hypothetical protein